jgi:hypothetical protein
MEQFLPLVRTNCNFNAMKRENSIWSTRLLVTATVIGFLLYKFFKRMEGRNSMKAKEYRLEKASSWQSIFLQSKVNGAAYNGEQLLGFNWEWPKDTFLQRRLKYLRKYRPSDELANPNQSTSAVSLRQELRN